jgi:hypothetical protein
MNEYVLKSFMLCFVEGRHAATNAFAEEEADGEAEDGAAYMCAKGDACIDMEGEHRHDSL